MLPSSVTQKPLSTIQLTIILTTIFLIGQYISWMILLVLIIAYLTLYFAYVKNISKQLTILMSIPIMLLLIGFLDVNNDHSFKDVIRDALYYAYPLIMLAFSYILAYRINNLEQFLKAMIYAGSLMALAHGVDIVLHYDYLFSDNPFRERVKGSSIVAVSLALLLLNWQYKVNRFSIISFLVLGGVLLVSLTLNFSRTMIIILGIFLIIGSGMIKFNLKTVLLGLVGSIFALWIISSPVVEPVEENKTLWNKLLYSVNEIRIQDYEDIKDINLHWRGYETMRGYQAFLNDGNIFDKFFGYGFGKTADLGLVMKLGTKEFSEIAIFHNGYINLLLKTGILGLVLYLLFLTILFVRYYNKRNWKSNSMIYHLASNLVAATAICFLFITFIIAGWLNPVQSLPLVVLIGCISHLLHRTISTYPYNGSFHPDIKGTE